MKNVWALVGMIALVSMTACEGDKKPENFYGKCVEVTTLLDGQKQIIVNSSSATGQDADIGVVTQPLYVANDKIWPVGAISVCWEDSTFDFTTAQERGWVRDSVETTWNISLTKAAQELEQPVTKFTGWERCTTASQANSVRIAAYETGPHAKMLGKGLKGYPEGVVFNFWFQTWSEVCGSNEADRQYCIRAIAVHEFGHVLGIAHEQNRPDSPGTCTDAPQGSNGNVLFGEWDLNSVMNYCAPLWNNGGELSAADDFWVRVAYYPGTINEAYCRTAADNSLNDVIPESVLSPSLQKALDEMTFSPKDTD